MFTLTGWLFNFSSDNSLNIAEKVRILLKKRINSTSYIIKGESISSKNTLIKYYKNSNYNSIWIGSNGQLPIANSLLSKIKESNLDGFEPSDYHLKAIETLKIALVNFQGLKDNPNYISKWVDFELLLSDAYFKFASNQYVGIIRFNKYNKGGALRLRSVNLIDSLKKAVQENKVKETLNNFSCSHSAYQSLKGSLKNFIEIKRNGGWINLPNKLKLKKGDKNYNVLLLRKRLNVLFPKLNVTDSIFDPSLEKVLKITQSNYGLIDDGFVYFKTIKALNVSIDLRIKQIKLNMERWRWLPRRLPQKYIFVNSAGFILNVIENDKSVLDMKIIVGKTTNNTPIFNADMTYIILNPWWEIPPSIATKEIIPKIRNDKNYLKKEHIIVLRSETDGKISYRFRQKPGPWNALGQIKFIFPNPYNIYLHDTPSKNLFTKNVRTFSHGCIRIEKPLELATYLLQYDPYWTSENLIKTIEAKKERKIDLDIPVKVHICYFTSWIDEENNPNFREDIYGYDKDLELILTRNKE